MFTGLDSFAALSVMGHLQHVAQATHQTVIATIHQPRSAIWEMFDMVRLPAHLAGSSFVLSSWLGMCCTADMA
jgi:hypothetical protein